MKTKRFFSVAIVMLLCSLLLMEPISASAASYGEQNAARTAKLYLLSGAFSKKGLIKQLKFEGYTGKEAKYAVNHCGASWKKQAVKGAKAYLRSGSFSKKGLIKQLKYEGYTSKEAAYGVKKCGANWKKQAVKSAKAYLRSSSRQR